jgi:predicted ATPase
LLDFTTIDTTHEIRHLGESMEKSFTQFKLLFRAFIRSVALPENPLILFLDDFQWADRASLDVLKSVITDGMSLNIIIICAFREEIREWITSALKVAVKEGLLEKTSHMDNYKLSHDKIQEVLYETLMPDEIERQLLHQRIGTLIWDSIQESERTQINDWFAFLAADNLNRSAGLIDYSGNRFYLVELNLTAAKRMIQKSAFFVASEYLRIAVEILELSTCWDERYDLCLDLFNTAAEVEKIIGCYSRSEHLIGVIHRHAKHLNHRSSAFVIEMDSLYRQGDVKASILLGLSVLRQLGIKFPLKINFLVVAKELIAVRLTQGRRKLHDLLSIHENTDERISIGLLIMRIVAMNAFFLGGAYMETFAVVCLPMLRLSMNHGISKMESPIAIVGWGLLNAVMGRFDVCQDAEKLAFALVHKYNIDSLRGSTIIFTYLFNHFLREKLDSDSRA